MIKFVLSASLTFLGLVMFGTGFCANEIRDKEDSNILIYSSSHAEESFSKKDSGILVLGITSFSPIIRIDINGDLIEVKKDTTAKIEYPFTLRTGENMFRLTVVTEEGRRRKTFIVNHGVKEKSKKSPFQLIGIVGATSVDNIYNATDDGEKQSDMKVVLTVVPWYSIATGESSVLQFRSIVLREKFSKEDYAESEISFTQLGAQWLVKQTFLGTVSCAVGMNDIRTNNENPLLGDTETMSETFFSGAVKQKLGVRNSWNAGFEYKLKDSQAELTDLDNDSDGAAWSLAGSLNLTLAGIDGSGKLIYGNNDAKGKYQDYSTLTLGLKMKYPIGDLTPSLGYTNKQKTLKEENPMKGNLAPENTVGTLSLKVGYNILGSGQIAATMVNKKQTSNVEADNYELNTTALSFSYVF